MSKYKEVFNARKLENDSAEKVEIQKSRNTQIQRESVENSKKGTEEKPSAGKTKNEKQVNLGIKVAESRRRYWVGQAKLRGLTISEIIIEALSKRLGEP